MEITLYIKLHYAYSVVLGELPIKLTGMVGRSFINIPLRPRHTVQVNIEKVVLDSTSATVACNVARKVVPCVHAFKEISRTRIRIVPESHIMQSWI